MADAPLASSGISKTSGPLRAFAYRQFRLLWGASLISLVSFFMVIIARGWLVLEMTDSPFLVTAVNAVAMIPMLVLSVFGGVMADRMNRRTILIAGDMASFFILLALAILLLIDVIQVWHVFALSVLHGVAFSLTMPTRNALVPSLVSPQHIASGVALFTTIFSAAQLVGPAVAGYAIDRFGMGTTFLIPSFMLVPAVAVLFLLRLPATGEGTERIPSGSVLASIAEGLAYIRRRPILVGLVLLGLVATVFGLPFQTILPVFARDILHTGPDGLGLLAAGGGAGAIVGSFTVAFFSTPRQLKWLLLIGGLGMGLLVLLFAISTVFVLSMALVTGWGFMIQIFLTSNMALLQVICPNYIRGRVIGIRMIVIGLGPIGMLLLGTGAEVFSPALSLGLMGACGLALTAAIVLATPTLRRAEGDAQEEALASADG